MSSHRNMQFAAAFSAAVAGRHLVTPKQRKRLSQNGTTGLADTTSTISTLKGMCF